MNRISVIVPTHNRAEALNECLISLAGQDYDKSAYEIIVVDNNSIDRTSEIVDGVCRLFPQLNLRRVLETREGLVYARHTGALNASFDILSYTDDDATLDPRWLMEISSGFDRYENVSAVGGRIIIEWDSRPPEWIRPYEGYLGKIDYGPHEFVSTNININGGNFSIKKDVLFELGGFNPDQVGEWLIGDGENGLCKKLHKGNHRVAWAPNAIMYHHQTVKKNATLTDIARRYANNGVAVPFHIYFVQKSGTLVLMLNLMLAFGKIAFYFALRLMFRMLNMDELSRKSLFKLHEYYSQVTYTLRICFDKPFRESIEQGDWILAKPSSAKFKSVLRT